jgi:hypothetical protein
VFGPMAECYSCGAARHAECLEPPMEVGQQHDDEHDDDHDEDEDEEDDDDDDDDGDD